MFDTHFQSNHVTNMYTGIMIFTLFFTFVEVKVSSCINLNHSQSRSKAQYYQSRNAKKVKVSRRCAQAFLKGKLEENILAIY